MPSAFLRGLPALLLVLGCLVVVGLVGLLGYCTGPAFSYPLLYLVPIAWAAWRGGFACGALTSLASAAAWHGGEALQGQAAHPAVWLLNGVIRFGVFVAACSLLARLRVSMLHEKALARTDPLTGAANGRTFYEEVYRTAERDLRADRPLTLAYLDLDDFKLLNDRQGHSAGDAALRHVAQTISQNVRAGDTLARLGGDEFALLLPETGGPEASAMLTRLHRLLAQEMAARGWPVTVSVGAATFAHPAADIDVMVGATDALMYAAKAAGKGRVEHRVVEDGPGQPSAGGRGMERRATARLLCGRLARVSTEAESGLLHELATVRDISADGIGLYLASRLPADTLLTIEPLHGGAMTLLARVLWSVAEEGGWAHGCALPTRLGDEELQFWLGEHPVAAPAGAS
jgi:diguanylate cyclase (GGDEF)-like protein